MSRRAYEELRSAIEQRGGSVEFLKEGYQWGAWEVRLKGRSRTFPSNGNGIPGFDELYEPKSHVSQPKHWSDYSKTLVPGAIEKLIASLK